MTMSMKKITSVVFAAAFVAVASPLAIAPAKAANQYCTAKDDGSEFCTDRHFLCSQVAEKYGKQCYPK